MDNTPIELIPTLSLVAEFERTIRDDMNNADNTFNLSIIALHAQRLWRELESRGVTLDTSQARD